MDDQEEVIRVKVLTGLLDVVTWNWLLKPVDNMAKPVKRAGFLVAAKRAVPSGASARLMRGPRRSRTKNYAIWLHFPLKSNELPTAITQPNEDKIKIAVNMNELWQVTAASMIYYSRIARQITIDLLVHSVLIRGFEASVSYDIIVNSDIGFWKFYNAFQRMLKFIQSRGTHLFQVTEFPDISWKPGFPSSNTVINTSKYIFYSHTRLLLAS